MKFKLNREESQVLIKALGDIKYCSDFEEDHTGEYITETEQDTGYEYEKELINRYWLFTLEDLLEIIPKYYYEGNEMRYFDMQYMGNFAETDFHHKWNVGYTKSKGIRYNWAIDRSFVRFSTYSEELIDALYKMILKMIDRGQKDMLKL